MKSHNVIESRSQQLLMLGSGWHLREIITLMQCGGNSLGVSPIIYLMHCQKYHLTALLP